MEQERLDFSVRWEVAQQSELLLPLEKNMHRPSTSLNRAVSTPIESFASVIHILHECTSICLDAASIPNWHTCRAQPGTSLQLFEMFISGT